MEEIESPRDRK